MYSGEARMFLQAVIKQCTAGTVEWDMLMAEWYKVLPELTRRKYRHRPDKTGSRSEEPLTPSANVMNAMPFFRGVLKRLEPQGRARGQRKRGQGHRDTR
jgi:hypothetical protein